MLRNREGHGSSGSLRRSQSAFRRPFMQEARERDVSDRAARTPGGRAAIMAELGLMQMPEHPLARDAREANDAADPSGLGPAVAPEALVLERARRLKSRPKGY